ncbi:MAG TPA: hypothetical protein VL099_09085 [Candidatus Binatia bacterium]|nr:hypothetical protein [Candidatus Binatia bacterium]
MGDRRLVRWLLAVLWLALIGWSALQAAQQQRSLTVIGYPGEIGVVEMSGRSYVEIEALARLTSASLSFAGNQVVLSLAGVTGPPQVSKQASASEFSKEFIRAGIEEMSVIREWRRSLREAVKQGFPVTEDWMARFRDQARQSLRLAGLAASTDSDRNASQLLTYEFNNMEKLSNRFVEANKSRTYMPPDSLDNDALDQKILACAHSLAAMAASGQFVDDGTCQ